MHPSYSISYPKSTDLYFIQLPQLSSLPPPHFLFLSFLSFSFFFPFFFSFLFFFVFFLSFLSDASFLIFSERSHNLGSSACVSLACLHSPFVAPVRNLRRSSRWLRSAADLGAADVDRLCAAAGGSQPARSMACARGAVSGDASSLLASSGGGAAGEARTTRIEL